MGLFSTVLHVYKKNQAEIISELSNELNQNKGFSAFERIPIDSSTYEEILSNAVYSQHGVFYLISQPHGTWTTIIEMNVNIDNPIYLYELTGSISNRLNTYSLSFHLHDGVVLYYNLEFKGEPLDGYNSDYQYFLSELASRGEIISQRHTPATFSNILPATKSVDELNLILNEGYWNAFDNGDLDEDGVPNKEKYEVDEEERFVRIGKYLEIYSGNDYPFANWYVNLAKLALQDYYLLKATK